MTTFAVFGATGRTGRLVVDELRNQAVDVVAIVRDPAGYDPPPGVTVRHGDVLDSASMRGVLDGVDTVISALGPRDGRQPTTVYSAGMHSIVEQMRAAEVRRLVAISAVPVSPPEENTFFVRRVLHPILWRFFGPSYADLRIMERDLAQSSADIDWTIVRPPLLTDDHAGTKPVRRAVGVSLARPKKIGRADLARQLVDIAADPATIHSVVTVSY